MRGILNNRVVSVLLENELLPFNKLSDVSLMSHLLQIPQYYCARFHVSCSKMSPNRYYRTHSTDSEEEERILN